MASSLDSEPIHFAAFEVTLKRHNKSISHDEYLEYFAGYTDKEGFERYFYSIGESVDLGGIIDEKINAYLKLAENQLVAYPGIVELIEQLSRQVPLALVTGSLKSEVTIALKTLGLETCFSVQVCAEDVKNGKPSREGYLKALAALGLPANECVIVEDSPSGVLAAKNAGIDCIAVTTTHTSEELSAATKIVNSLALANF